MTENPNPTSNPKFSGWRSGRAGSALPSAEIVPRFAGGDDRVSGEDGQAISALLLEAVDQARAVADADGAAVALRDSQGLVCRASSGEAPEVGSRPAVDSGFTGECLRTGRAMVCQDAENDSRIKASLAKSIGLASAAAVPISEAESTLGVLEVFSSRTFAFDSADITRLEEIASKVASGLSASRKTSFTPGGAEFAPVDQNPPARPWLVSSGAVAASPALAPSEAAPPVTEVAVEENLSVQEERSSTRLWLIAVAVAAIALVTLIFYIGRGKSSEPSSNIPTSTEAEAPLSPSNPELKNGESVGQAPSHPPDTAAVVSKDQESPKTDFQSPLTSPTTGDAPSIAAEADRSLPAADHSDQRASNARRPLVLKPYRPKESETPPEVQIAELATASPDLALKTTMPKPLPIPLPDFKSQRTFHGHSSWISGLAFSPDGRRLASSSWDRSVKLWEVPGGNELTAVTGKMMEVQTLAFSPDGHLLATENSSNAVTFWDAATGREILTLPSNRPQEMPGKSWVYSIAFSPDSRWLATGLDDKTIRVWDVETGHPLFDLSTSRRAVTYVAFSADGRWLASGSDDKTIAIWDVATRKIVRTLSGHKKSVYAVAFSPNGRWLASASADKSVKLWELSSGREVHSLAGHGSSVTSVSFSPDSRWLASGSWDKTTKIWDVERGQELQTLPSSRPVYAVAFDSRGGWLASGTQDGTIKLWHSSRP